MIARKVAERDQAAVLFHVEGYLARDRAADGLFWYGVVSTGIYCRPACPSRPAKPKNMRFFDSPQEARAAGLRACRRCLPDGRPREADVSSTLPPSA